MKKEEFCARMMADIMLKAGAPIIIGRADGDTVMKELVESRCVETLKQIRDVLDDDTYTDADCFRRIEEIVRIYENLGCGAGSRHDFG